MSWRLIYCPLFVHQILLLRSQVSRSQWNHQPVYFLCLDFLIFISSLHVLVSSINLLCNLRSNFLFLILFFSISIPQASSICDHIWTDISQLINLEMSCVNLKSVMPAAVFRFLYRTTENGLWGTNRGVIILEEIPRSCHVLRKFPDSRNIGLFISLLVRRSIWGPLDANDSLICLSNRMKFMSIRIFHGAKILCSPWSSEQKKTENMLCILAIISES